MSEGEFSLYQFFEDGSYEAVYRYISLEEVLDKWKHYTNNVAAVHGITRRVIITDGGDLVAREWKYGEGVTYNVIQ